MNEPKTVIFFLFYINFALVHILMIVMVIHTSKPERIIYEGKLLLKIADGIYTFIVAVNPTLWGKEVIKVSLENLAL